MTTTPAALRRRTTAASAALLLGLTLAACGGGDDDSDEPSDAPTSESSRASSPEPEETSSETTEETTDAAPGDVPSEDELAAVLLTADDVPAGFTQAPADDDESDDEAFAGTCLADIGEFKEALGAEPDSEAEVEYGTETQQSQAGVTSQVEAYADPSVVAPAFADFTDTLQECTSIETTDEQGVTFALDIAYDDSVDLPGADDQLAIDMTGTVSAGGQSFDVVYQYVVALAGPYITIVGTYTLGDDTSGVTGSTDDLASLQAERVASLG